jgi:FkbM family methyltransferase
MKRSWRLFSNKEVTRAIPDAGAMTLRPWEYIEARLFFYRIWEPEITRFIDAHLGPGDVAIDIGANIGYYSLLMSRKVGPRGKVYAAEPSPSIRARLEHNIAINNLQNVVVLPYGISNKAEERYLQLSSSDNSGESRFVDDPTEKNLEGKLPLRRLVDLVPAEALARASLVKVDVEGMEVEVLEDLLDNLGVFPGKISICAEVRRFGDGAARVDALIDRFRRAGFVLYRFDNRYLHSDYAKQTSRAPQLMEALPEGQHDVAFVRG